jgi:hypothetical protein
MLLLHLQNIPLLIGDLIDEIYFLSYQGLFMSLASENCHLESKLSNHLSTLGFLRRQASVEE